MAPLSVLSQVIVFPDDAASGYCQRTDIVFRLDQQVNITDLFGRKLELTARVTDADGAAAEDTKTVVLSRDAHYP
ncbi:hypothetical protein [Sorangium sp. So ce1335]|uniref:hypothetical protein n=1 Tax=Sorangium sp. So ce1335 TaxID=3133335 RepID=UPI003F60E0A9